MALLFLVATEVHFPVVPARAIQQEGDYWFTETLTLGDTDLPDGVAIRPSDPTEQPRAVLAIENQTEPLLFVLSLTYKDVLVMETPDPLWKERVELAHEVASYLAAPNHPALLDMPALTDLDPALEDRNVPASAPSPAGVAVPGAQVSELLLVYDGRVILVPFTLSYQLNPSFTPEAPGYHPPSPTQQVDQPNSEDIQAPQSLGTSMIAAVSLLAIGLGIAAWRVWRKTHHPK